MYRQSWDDTAATGLTAIVVVAAIAVAVALAITAVVTAKELGRIFATRAVGQATTTARVLWLALAGYLGIVLTSGLLLTNPAFVGLALLLLSWGFLTLVVACECCDLFEQRREQGQVRAVEQLDTYLHEPFMPTLPTATHTNGKTPTGTGIA